MIFKFGRKKFSDVVKVVAFLDKESIDYEVLTDIEVGIGGIKSEVLPSTDTDLPPASAAVIAARDADASPIRKPGEGWLTGVDPLPAVDSDPLWRVAQHDNRLCRDKPGCKSVEHYGGEPL